MREVAVADLPAEGTGRVRHPRHEDAPRDQRMCGPVECVQHLGLGEMLEHVRGGHRGQLPGPHIEQTPVVALLDPVQACRPEQRHLFRADINSRRVVLIRQYEPDQLPPPAADVEHRPGGRRRSSGRMSRR